MKQIKISAIEQEKRKQRSDEGTEREGSWRKRDMYVRRAKCPSVSYAAMILFNSSWSRHTDSLIYNDTTFHDSGLSHRRSDNWRGYHAYFSTDLRSRMCTREKIKTRIEESE